MLEVGGIVRGCTLSLSAFRDMSCFANMVREGDVPVVVEIAGVRAVLAADWVYRAYLVARRILIAALRRNIATVFAS